MSVLITIIVLRPRKGTKIKVWNLTDGLDAYTALYRRRQTMAGDPVLELFQTIYKKRQNYNSDKLLSSVDEKISCALAHKTPWWLFYTSTWGLKSHIKNVIGLALSIFAICLTQTRHTFSNTRFEHIRVN